ncbi:hypothetical protein ACFYP4_02515 [Streptomyces sp. NPDC005551]|uniref:hypothetical protein n=1 Tax=Streptomyces sp. NPDC005551 TaxID=3364725 RepID=UPI0036A80DFC
MSTHYLESVSSFHRAFGVPKLVQLSDQEQLVSVALRATLIEEETTEYFEALEQWKAIQAPDTFPHMAKELADLLYVVMGTADVLGVTTTVQATPNHLSYSLTDLVLRTQSRIAVQELTYLGRMIHYGDPIEAAVEALGSDLQSLVQSIARSASKARIPLRKVFDEVHRSNMSKLNPDTGKPERREDGKVLKGPWYKEADLSFLQREAA